jgi:hypothetical protein
MGSRCANLQVRWWETAWLTGMEARLRAVVAAALFDVLEAE